MLLSRRSLIIAIVAAVFGLSGSAIAQNVPPAAPVGHPPTIWHFLGLRQGSWMKRDAFLNASGNFPGLERTPPLKRLADPGLKEIDNAAIKKAQEIKAEEELAPQKIKAIKYLATLGCEKCYGGIEEAMLESLKDCTEEVRYETVRALGTIPNQQCPMCDHDCCTEKLTAQLAKIAYERDPERPDCWYEPSARVREEARRVLSICCQAGPPPIIEELPPGPGPEPKPEPRPEPRPELRPTGTKAAVFRLPVPGSSTVWVQDRGKSRKSGTAGINPAARADVAGRARADKPSLAESIRGVAHTNPPARQMPTRAARQLAPTPAEPPIQREVAQDEAQITSRRVQPVSRLQQPTTLRQAQGDEPDTAPAAEKPQAQSPGLAPANASASATVETRGLSQPIGLLPMVGIIPGKVVTAAAASPQTVPPARLAVSNPDAEPSVMRLASIPQEVSLVKVKRLPDAAAIQPPPLPKVEGVPAQAPPKPVTYGTQGTVARVSPQGGTIEVKFPSGGVPRVGSRMQVHHQYLFKTGYIGDLQVIATGAGVATAKPFDGLDLAKVSTGDTVILQSR
jgi:hypothetical protein